MYNYSKNSMEQLRSCTQTIQTVFNIAIQFYDITILEGSRPQSRQWDLFMQGRSLKAGAPKNSKNAKDYEITGRWVTKVDGYQVRSMHNHEPSKAIDAAPYPIDFWVNEQKAIDKFVALSQKQDRLSHTDVRELMKYSAHLAKVQARFYYFAGRILQIADQCYKNGVTKELLRWGGDWDRDHDFTDQNFDDLPHFEVYTP